MPLDLDLRKPGWRAFLLMVCLGGSCRIAFSQAAESVHAESLFQWRNEPSNWVSPAVERERIVTDRPHVSEATSTVGLGHLQVETGYSFFQTRRDGTTSSVHSFPEPLLRWGILADWFELRLGWNYLIETESPALGKRTQTSGSDDMLLAAKVALFKQDGWLPDLTIFPQARLPTGADAFSGDQVLPGVNIAYSWSVTKIVELECNTVFNRKRDDLGHFYTEMLQTLNVEYDLGDRWMAFTEYLAFLPMNSHAANFEHYFHCGVHYFITPNLQIDLHSAVGLNAHSDQLAFTGIGLSWKY